MKRVVAASVLASVLGLAPCAFAANDSRATALFGVLGEEKRQTLAVGASGFFVYSLTAGRSYMAFCWQSGVEGGGSCDVEVQDDAGNPVGVASTAEPSLIAGGHTG